MKLTPIGTNVTELELENGITVLFSYRTPVAAFVPGLGVIRTEEKFSQTTTKHTNKWIRTNHPNAKETVMPQEKIERFAELL